MDSHERFANLQRALNNVGQDPPTIREDPYANTSLAGVPPIRYRHVITTLNIHDDEFDYEDDIQPITHAEALEMAALQDNQAAANRIGDELTLHYRTEEPLRQSFRLSLQRFEQREPTGFADFRSHMLNAHLFSPAEVRRYDIIAWFARDLPAYVDEPLEALQGYYHQEAHLRAHLATLEGRGVQDDSSQDQEYAVLRYGKAKYGYETKENVGGDGYHVFRPLFEGRLQLRWIIAGVEIRRIRVSFALPGERHGKWAWEHEKCVERKVMGWIVAAESHLVATDFEVTSHEEQDVFEEAEQQLEVARERIQARKEKVEALRELRKQKEEKVAGMGGVGSVEMVQEVAELERRIEELVQIMEEVYGLRKWWDWVQE